MLLPVANPLHLTSDLLGTILGSMALCVILAYVGLGLLAWQDKRRKTSGE